MRRKAAVSGQFYPADPGELRGLIEQCLEAGKKGKRSKALGVVVPHAGYIYSGAVAGAALAQVEIPGTVLILGVNHRGVGSPYSIQLEGTWETPLGEVPIEARLASALQKESALLVADPAAQQFEHSLEVEVPFLQVLNPGVQIVPICIGGMTKEELQPLGESVAAVLQNWKEPVLILASTDFSHYIAAAEAKKKDRFALEAIESLDGAGLLGEVWRREISMCGFAPTACALFALKKLGASQARLIRYSTSGDVTGEYDSVVAYASFLIR